MLYLVHSWQWAISEYRSGPFLNIEITFALASQKGGSELVVSGNIAGAAFTHLAARPSLKSERPDPQLHTHVVLLNVTKRPDGEWRGLRPIEIYRSQQYGSAIYRSELAREVQSLGYRIEVVAPNGAWELQGYSREQVEVFSQRRQDIEEVMAEKRVNDPRARQMIALQTRQSKGDIDPDVLKAEWQQRAVEHGIDTLAIRREARHRLGIAPADPGLSAAEAVNFAAAHTTEREAVIDRRELEKVALIQGMGRTHLDEIRGQIVHQEGVRRLIPTHQRDWKHPQGQFTTDAMIALERDNLALVRKGVNVAAPIVDQATIRQLSTAKGLFADQLRAAEVTLTATNWVTAIEGLAGTTKTTTVGAIREFAEGRGYTVRGFGMTSGSVKALSQCRRRLANCCEPG